LEKKVEGMTHRHTTMHLGIGTIMAVSAFFGSILSLDWDKDWFLGMVWRIDNSIRERRKIEKDMIPTLVIYRNCHWCDTYCAIPFSCLCTRKTKQKNQEAQMT